MRSNDIFANFKTKRFANQRMVAETTENLISRFYIMETEHSVRGRIFLYTVAAIGIGEIQRRRFPTTPERQFSQSSCEPYHTCLNR